MMQTDRQRRDFDLISTLVPDGARVLDVGCGDGALLTRLRNERAAIGRGLEVDPRKVSAALARGLSVIQGNADADLPDYPDAAFDVVLLTRSIQAMQRPDRVLQEARRIGRRVIVSFPNFGHWRVRLSLLRTGRMPVSQALPEQWYQTENIHLCTVRDFFDLCRAEGAPVEQIAAIRHSGRADRVGAAAIARANWLAEEAIFVLTGVVTVPPRQD